MERPVKRRVFAVFSLLLFVAAAVRAIDFTPTVTVKKLERFSIKVLTFYAGDKRASYKPPAGWTSEGATDALTLTPPQSANPSMKLFSLDWSPEQTAKLNTPEAEAKWALGYLPPAAAEVEIAATNESPFTLGIQPSREWIIKYQLEGIVHKTSVSRCDITPGKRLVILMAASSQGFDAFRQDGIASLFSWEWLEASPPR
jgi:hypothetical protein